MRNKIIRHIRRILSLSVIIQVTLLLVSCSEPVSYPNEDTQNDSKNGVIMTNTQFNYQEAIRLCQQGNTSQVESLLSNLSDPGYLAKLDDPSVYIDIYTPPNLQQLLECLLQRSDLPWVIDRIVALSKTPAYNANDDAGSVRYSALVAATGAAQTVTPSLITFLDRSLEAYEEQFQANSVKSLAALGTPESVNILRSRIFDPQNSVVEEEVQSVYWQSYTVLVGQHRDKVPVLSLMLDTLYHADVSLTVLQCLVEDVVQTAPDPEYRYKMAPLNAQTPDSIILAQKLAAWLIQYTQDIQDYQPQIAKRVTDLLAVAMSAPSQNESSEVRRWAIEVFKQAIVETDDLKRKKEIQTAITAFK